MNASSPAPSPASVTTASSFDLIGIFTLQAVTARAPHAMATTPSSTGIKIMGATPPMPSTAADSAIATFQLVSIIVLGAAIVIGVLTIVYFSYQRHVRVARRRQLRKAAKHATESKNDTDQIELESMSV